MEKVIINLEYGAGRLSEEAITLLAERLGRTSTEILMWCDYEPWWLRYRPELIDIVEELGERANGRDTCFIVCEIPDEYRYSIENFGKL